MTVPVSQVTEHPPGQQDSSACAQHAVLCDLDTSAGSFGRDFGGFLTSEKFEGTLGTRKDPKHLVGFESRLTLSSLLPRPDQEAEIFMGKLLSV